VIYNTLSVSIQLQVRNCRLVGLLDLDLGKPYVRRKVVSYLNRLVDIGVAGFRVDAVKHMWPGDVQAIYDSLNDLNTSAGFAAHTRPFIYNEASHYYIIVITKYFGTPNSYRASINQSTSR